MAVPWQKLYTCAVVASTQVLSHPHGASLFIVPAMAASPAHVSWFRRLPEFAAQARSDQWLPLLVLATSLAVTAYSWRTDWRQAEQALQADFDFHVQEALATLEQRLASYQQVLRGARSMLASSPHQHGREFQGYVAALDLPHSHPALQELRFVGDAHGAGSSSRMVTAIVLRQPFAEAAAAAGGTVRSAEAARDDTTALARRRGALTVSGKLALPATAQGETQPGVMMVLPVARQDPRQPDGWIEATLRVADLMAPASGLPELDVEIYDGDQLAAPQLLFDTDGQPMASAPTRARYRAVSRLPVANRVWTVAVRSLPPLEARLDRSATVKGWFGVGTSVLLALVTWLLAGSRARAVASAQTIHRELSERETRYRHMFEHSAPLACLLDPAGGRIVDANHAAAAFWGYPLRRLRRMTIFDLDAGQHAVLQALLRDAAAGATPRLECRHRIAGGDMRDVELYAGRLIHQGKTLIYTLVHDISARKQAEHALCASEERFRLIAENSGDVVWMIDARTMRFTYVSPSIERQNGYTPAELIALHAVLPATPHAGTPMASITPKLQDRIARFIAGDESLRREVVELELPRKNGPGIPVEVVSTLLCDEEHVPTAVIGVCRDISARRAAQEEQKRFMAMVSHEFRTPLATIDGAVQRLQSTASQVDAATHHRFMKIQKAADRLTALLDDYLTLDRIDTAGHGLHLSQASPLALLRDAKASADALSAGHVVEIDTQHAPPGFLCDADRVRLALRVLADNAVKYTLPGSRILLRATGTGDGIAFTVADNGRGIPSNELPQVFDKFFRGLSASQQSGSGLGLHLARSVAEMHGGTLAAGNRPEGGAQFTFWLPNQSCGTDSAIGTAVSAQRMR